MSLMPDRIAPDFLPPVFGPDGTSHLDPTAARAGFAALAAQLHEEGRPMSADAVAAILAEHLPGKHDQSTHGRGGGAAGPGRRATVAGVSKGMAR